MKKLAWLLLLLPLLACKTLLPEAAPMPRALPSATLAPVATEPVEATAFAPGADFTLLRLHPQDGDLQAQLAAQAARAQALHQTFFIEFDATWCPPCQAITASLAERNDLMMKAYSGIYLVHIDIDEWDPAQIAQAGFPPIAAIPVFFALDGQGQLSGPTVDGGAWGDNIPENMAPVLGKFFHP